MVQLYLPLCGASSLYLRDKGLGSMIKYKSDFSGKMLSILVKRENVRFSDVLHYYFVLPAPLLKNNTWNIPFITA